MPPTITVIPEWPDLGRMGSDPFRARLVATATLPMNSDGRDVRSQASSGLTVAESPNGSPGEARAFGRSMRLSS